MKPNFTRLVLATVLCAGGLATAQTTPRAYTFLPTEDVFTLPETMRGVAHFTLTNLLDSPLTVSGYRSRATFIRRSDRRDDFQHQILGLALPYEIAPGGSEDIPVVITPDLIGGDPVEDLSGMWNLIVRPTVRRGSLDDATLAELPIVGGRVRALRVVITDVPVPEAETWALVASGLGLVMIPAVRRRPKTTYC